MKKITFIIPTKNRTHKLIKFIKFHNFLLKSLNSKFLIVDGSNNYNHTELKLYIKKNKNIILLKQKSKGMMNACFESIKHVDSEYCTFLYDDDFLSKEVIKIFKKNLNGEFAMGYGLVNKIDQNIPTQADFKKIKIFKYNLNETILAYYGNKISDVPYMPVSPICMIFKSSFLKEWKQYVIKYCAKSYFRTDFILKKNIGADLILYLLQILKQKKINISKPHIARFGEHETSMSYLLGLNNLQIGYWLAKKSVFDYGILKEKSMNFKFYNFLYLAGYFMLIKNFFLKILVKKNYFNELLVELADLKKNKNAKLNLFELVKILINKVF